MLQKIQDGDVFIFCSEAARGCWDDAAETKVVSGKVQTPSESNILTLFHFHFSATFASYWIIALKFINFKVHSKPLANKVEKLPGGDELVGVGGQGVHPLGDQGQVGEEEGGRGAE